VNPVFRLNLVQSSICMYREPTLSAATHCNTLQHTSICMYREPTLSGMRRCQLPFQLAWPMCVCARVRVCECVRERERESNRESVCACAFARENEQPKRGGGGGGGRRPPAQGCVWRNGWCVVVCGVETESVRHKCLCECMRW